MAVYFLRHGQSEANVAGAFSPTDAILTDLGEQQAREAAELLHDYHIQNIVCSGMERSWQTAAIVADILGVGRDAIVHDSRLNEYDMGSLTGQPSEGVSAAELVGAPGAEDPAAFQRRVVAAVAEYAGDVDNTLIVSHAGVGCILQAKQLDMDPAKFYEITEYPNGRVIELSFD